MSKGPRRLVPASRLDSIEISLIRQINALATPLSINLGLGEPNLEPDEELRGMARSAASNSSWHYTHNAGNLSLREKIAEVRCGARYDPRTEITVTAGTSEGLYAVMQAFVDTGDEVLVPDPGFVSYPVLARLAGGTPVTYPLEPPHWTPDPADIERRLTPRTRLIVVNSPSNPTGGVIEPASLERIALLAEERGIAVVSDEVYSEVHYEARPASMMRMGSTVIVLNGMSKSHGMTGLRMAWIAADAPLMKPILTMHQYIATCVSSFTQSLAELVLQRPEWNRRWLDNMRAQFRAQRDAAVGAVAQELQTPVEPPGGAFYLFVPVPVCGSESLARSLAAEAAVLTIPGIAFGARGEGFLRISFAQTPENIRKGIGRVAGHLAGKA